LTTEELNAILEPTKLIAEEYGVYTYIEEDLLSTFLFEQGIAKKNVVLIAVSKEVIEEYFTLKEMKKENLDKNPLR
jgi:hypothetical protein